MATSTRVQLLAYLVQHYDLGWLGNNTGASQTALTDDYVFGGHGGNKEIQVGDEVRLLNGDEAGDQSRLATTPALTTGTMTLDPGLSAATSTAVSTLGAELTATQTSLTVASATPFPTVAPFVATIDTSAGGSGPERVLVTDVSGTTWTIVRNYANTVNGGTHASGEEIDLDDAFAILRSPLRFYDVHAAITEAMHLFEWEMGLVPFSRFADANMRATSPTADWGTASSATPTKIAATFPLGERVLRVTASGNAGYALTNNVPVEESVSYYLEVTGMIGSTGAAADAGTLQLIDVTNSNASITLDNSAIDRFEPEVLSNPSVAMPSGCEQVHVRLEATLNGDIIDWANLIFRKNEDRVFVLEDRPQRVKRIGRVFAATAKKWHTRGSLDDYEIDRDVDQLTSGLFQVRLRQSVAGLSVWYEEFFQPAEMFSDTDTTTIKIEELAAVAAEQLLKAHRGRSDDWALRYQKAQIEAAGVIVRYHEGVHKVKSKPQTRFPQPAV